jgi:tetratricopeptide (TPR) repeat protein
MKHCFRFSYLCLATLLLWIWSFSFLSVSCHAEEQIPELVKVVSPSVVLILVLLPGDTTFTAMGTGFIITEKGDVITNYHVIRPGVLAKIVLYNQDTLDVKGIVAKDEDMDLVRLALADVDTTFKPLTISDSAEAGQRIVVIGHPFGKFLWSVSTGDISALRYEPKLDAYFIQHNAVTYGGSSGSPVFNLRREVIGIHAGTYLNPQDTTRTDIHYAISASKIKNLQPEGLVTLPEERASKDTMWAKSPEGEYFLGIALYQIGEYADALLHLKETLKSGIGEKDTSLYFKTADCFEKLINIGYIKDISEFNDEIVNFYINICEKLVSIKPDSFDLWFRLGRLYKEKKHYRKAAQAFEKAKLIEQHDFSTLYNLAEAYLSPDLVLLDFGDTVEVGPDSCYDDIEFGRLIRFPSKAIGVLKEALKIAPESCFVHQKLGWAYAWLGRYEEAEKALNNATTLDSTCCKDAYYALNRVEEARKSGKRINCWENLEPFKPIPFKPIPLKPPIMPLSPEVLPLKTPVIRVQPPQPPFPKFPNLKLNRLESANLSLCRGIYEVSIGHYEEALQKFKESIEICSVLVDGYEHLIALYSKLGRYQDGVEVLKDAIRVKDCFVWAHHRLVIINSILGLHLESGELFEKVGRETEEPCEGIYALDSIGYSVSDTISSPTFKITGTYGADSIFSVQNRELQIPTVVAINLAILPDTAFKFCALGVVCEARHDTAEAMEMYKQAIQIYPNFAEAHFLLGRAYVSLGDLVSALKELKILKDLNNFLADKLLDLIYPR